MFLETIRRVIRKFSKKLDTLNTIHISKKAVLHNIAFFQSKHKKKDIFPVLKANAYGHGIEQMVWALKKLPITYYVADSYYEALKIRAIDKKAKVLIIGYTLPENISMMDFSFVTPIISTIEDLHYFGRTKKKCVFHLKVDTGMHRQGILPDKIADFLEILWQYPNISLEGVCTHYADADNPKKSTYTDMQYKLFQQVVKQIKQAGYTPKYIHTQNTAWALQRQDKISNAIRLGIGLYGIDPLDWLYMKKLQPVMKVESTLIQKKRITRGEKVSYNCTFTARKNMDIGIVPIGYYEGILRELSNKYHFSYKWKKLPILWRVCMNLCVVDVTNIDVKVGDRITVIDNKIDSLSSVYQYAHFANTITYVATTNFSESIRRVVG